MKKIFIISLVFYSINGFAADMAAMLGGAAATGGDAATTQQAMGAMLGVVSAVCGAECSGEGGGCSESMTGAKVAVTAGVKNVGKGIKNIFKKPETGGADGAGAAEPASAEPATDTAANGEEAPAEGGEDGGGNKMACALTALSAAESVAQFMGASESQDAADKAEEAKKEITGTNTDNAAAMAQGSLELQSEGSGNPTSSSTVGNSRDALTRHGTGAACGRAQESGSNSDAYECVSGLSGGGKFASAIANPEFRETFKKTSGMEIGEFLKAFGKPGQHSPSTALAAAHGGGGTNGSISALKEKFQKLENNEHAKRQTASANYRRGGKRASRGGSGADAGEPDPMAEAAAMMEQLMGGAGAKGKATGPQNNIMNFVEARIKNKTADQVVDDRGLGLFDRIHYRYQKVSRLYGFPSGLPEEGRRPASNTR